MSDNYPIAITLVAIIVAFMRYGETFLIFCGALSPYHRVRPEAKLWPA
ncbi:hypothetical protein SAMN05518854_103182 [Variovorax sp. YR266]|nr:hypothetical protein SAMN05518854_103182 [Variovorax sp. YR266]